MDIYALGAVLFEILTGERVHAAISFVEIRQHLSPGRTRTPRSLNPTVPRALEAICLRALQYNPEDRYPDVASLAEDVRAWMRGARVSVHKDRIDQQISRVLARWLGRAQRVPASKASLGR
jgi:eukaryotic-like serine/threonine-protein kinase